MESPAQRRTPCASPIAATIIPTRPIVFVAQQAELSPADRFIVERLPIAARIARRRASSDPDLWADLFQEACLALVEMVRVLAPQSFPGNIAHLEAQSIIWMHHRVVLAIAWHNTSAYSLPIHALRDWVRVRHVAHQLQEELGRTATPAEISSIVHLPAVRITRLLATSNPVIALETLPEDPATPSADPPPDVLYQRVRTLVAALPEPERTIITRQFGLGCPKMSLRTLSQQLHLTVRQLTRHRQRGLAMLHTWLTQDASEP